MAYHGTLTTFDYPRKKGTPRPAGTYRGARRNAARDTTWPGVNPTSSLYQPPVRANARDRTKIRRTLAGGANLARDFVRSMFGWLAAPAEHIITDPVFSGIR